MQTEWAKFLHDYGANITDNKILNFGQKDTEIDWALTDYIITPLSHIGVVEVGGTDASKFLQGQLSCDVSKLSNQLAPLAVLCNRKGRVYSTLRIFLHDEKYYLIMPQEIIASCLENLNRYARFSKVELKDASDKWIHIGYSGASATERLQEFYQQPLPTHINHKIVLNDQIIITLPGIFPRYEIFGSFTSLQRLWGYLETHAHPCGEHAWTLLDIRAGLAQITTQTLMEFTPHMLNYHLIEGISFTKGCYTGQEIIARTHYLGKLKQHLYRGILFSTTLPQPGEKLYDNDLKTEVGTIVSACKVDHSQVELLAVIKTSAAESNHIYYRMNVLLQLLKLPYDAD